MNRSASLLLAAMVGVLGYAEASIAASPRSQLNKTATGSVTATSTCSGSTNTWCVGADGWTVFNGTPGTGTCGDASSTYSGTCVVYVANSGNDATCKAQALPVTSTPAYPCATPTKAQTLLRDNSPDWMLLKKGDTWNGGMSGAASGLWWKNGRSAAEPMLISSYGTGARPQFKTSGVDTSCYSTIKTYGQFTALVGIECYNDSADPSSPSYLGVTVTSDTSATSPTLTNIESTIGIAPGYIAVGAGVNALTVRSVTANSVTLSANPQFTSQARPIQFNKPFSQALFSLVGTTNFLIVEDCKLNFGSMAVMNINYAAPIQNLDLRIRRNVIVDGYGAIGHGTNGVFLSDNQSPNGKILIEENLVDNVGWNSAIWGAAGNVFSHNFYLHDNNPPISFKGNITANASATGAQIRNGGTVYNNLAVGNPIGFVTSPGIQANSTSYSYNVIAGGSDIILGVRFATAATNIGSKVVSLDGAISAFVGNLVTNIDNPGSITGTVGSVGPTGIIASAAVASGTRGDGVRSGDRIAVFSPRAQGITIGPSGTVSPTTNSGTTYPVGSTTFYFPTGYELPSWIVPGMTIGVYDKAAFSGAQTTTIASISADRKQLQTTAPTSMMIVGGSAATGAEQNAFVIWSPGDDSHLPPQTVGPNNVFTTSKSYYRPSFAIAMASLTRSINASGNFFYNWNVTTANVADYGVPASNTFLPSKMNVFGTNSNPNATVEAYDKSIGGPGTVSHFLSQARKQSRDSWDVRYTANAVNNYIRNAVGCNCMQ